MANVIQLKRGNEAQRTGFTPAAGEPIFILDENKMYIGDGSTAVQSLSALGGDLTLANGSNNRVLTATSSSAMNGEANLTFDGSTLAVTGDATVSDDLGLVSDSAKLTFGANSEVELVHVHNEGLILKHTATADDKPVSLVLQTGETDIAANDVIGKIGFQAPDEGTGTDAILMAAEIAAISEGDFAADNNATKMVFRTGSSAAAADRMTLSSGGNLNVTGTITGTGTSVFADLDISGDVDVDGTLEADAMTLDGTAITTTATLSTGISNNNVPKFTSGVADNDFLRVDGTAIEGRSASEVLSDISAAPAAGDSNIVTTGALNSGSITSGFGNIDNGSSTLDTGALTATTITGVGDMTVTGDTATFQSANSTDPLLIVKNTTNDANGARMRFVKDKGAAGADNDVAGVIEFVADDDAQAQTTFAKITASIADASK